MPGLSSRSTANLLGSSVLIVFAGDEFWPRVVRNLCECLLLLVDALAVEKMFRSPAGALSSCCFVGESSLGSKEWLKSLEKDKME